MSVIGGLLQEYEYTLPPNRKFHIETGARSYAVLKCGEKAVIVAGNSNGVIDTSGGNIEARIVTTDVVRDSYSIVWDCAL